MPDRPTLLRAVSFSLEIGGAERSDVSEVPEVKEPPPVSVDIPEEYTLFSAISKASDLSPPAAAIICGLSGFWFEEARLPFLLC